MSSGLSQHLEDNKGNIRNDERKKLLSLIKKDKESAAAIPSKLTKEFTDMYLEYTRIEFDSASKDIVDTVPNKKVPQSRQQKPVPQSTVRRDRRS
jgi:hypothetical protein